MKVLKVRNVNQALTEGLAYLLANGIREESRAGPVLVAPEPVSTVYLKPQERVLFSPARNANPFFHLFESLWLLAGRNDAKWLDQFVHDFSSRFAEADGTMHGSYGHRWRNALGFDQLDHVVETLKRDPSSRQCVIQMWDASVIHEEAPLISGWNDLCGKWADRPCNTQAYLRVRQQQVLVPPDGGDEKEPVLDITVCCRSNDLWWGAYGANAVQFSVLQEYLAARIGVGTGTYTQISNNYHLYYDMMVGAAKVLAECDPRSYPEVTPIVTVPEQFDLDLKYFFSGTPIESGLYSNSFFPNVAIPLYEAHKLWKAGKRTEALAAVSVDASDWFIAAQEWMQRRMSSLRRGIVEKVV